MINYYHGFYVGEPILKGNIIFIDDEGNFTNRPTKIAIGINEQDIVNCGYSWYNEKTTIRVIHSGIINMEHKFTNQQRQYVNIGDILYWNWKTQKINIKKNRNNIKFGILIKSLNSTEFCKVKLCL